MSVEADLKHERRRRYPLAKVKGGWTNAEDQILKRLVDEFGEGNWSVIARHLNAALGKPADSGRIGKQCRERYNHHLRPDIKKDAWTEEEESLLVSAHLRYGNRWSDIAKVIKGRTENAVKNHWNATLRRKDSDKCSNRNGNGTQQSCILKDYMVRIALLPGPPTGSGPTPTAAIAADNTGVGPSAYPFENMSPSTTITATSATSAAMLSSVATRAIGTCTEAHMHLDGSVVNIASSQNAKRLWVNGEAVGAEALVAAVRGAVEATKPSQCSSDESQALAEPVGSLGALDAAPSLPAAADYTAHSLHVMTPPALPRKRPRIITFVAMGPDAGGVGGALILKGVAPRPRASGCPSPPPRDGLPPDIASSALARGASAASKHRPLQQPHALDLHLPERGPRLQRRGPDRQPGWATDSAEESVHGSPMSEGFEHFEEDGEEGAGISSGEGQGCEGDGSAAACSEIQAAEIMLALKSIAGWRRGVLSEEDC